MMSDRNFKALMACIAVLIVMVTLSTCLGGNAESNTPPPPGSHIRCPEDADLVVRYYAGPGDDPPAGIVAFCLASDAVEEVID